MHNYAAAGARRGPRSGQFAAMRAPDGVKRSFYCSLDLRAAAVKAVRARALITLATIEHEQKTL